MSRERHWKSPAQVAGPIKLQADSEHLTLELGPNASRTSSRGNYVGGAYVIMTQGDVESFIKDLCEALASMKELNQ